MGVTASGLFLRILEPWFPVECGGCGRSGDSPCGHCLDALEPAEVGPVPEGLDDLIALIAYDEVSGPLIAAVKQRGELAVLRALVPAMALLVPDLAEHPFTLTWAPTTGRRRRKRGFDQSEEIARILAGELGRRPVGLLRRSPGPAQTGRDRAERLHGVRFDSPGSVEGLVVVVDDVVTTGATLSAAARALRDAGADAVIGLALARTPDRHAI